MKPRKQRGAPMKYDGSPVSGFSARIPDTHIAMMNEQAKAWFDGNKTQWLIYVIEQFNLQLNKEEN